MKTTAITLMAILAALFFVTPSLWAQMAGPGTGNIKAGPVEVHPFVGVAETYNDNIYQSYGGLKKESDYITTLSPGLRLLLPVRRHSFQLAYRADMNWYAKNDETNYTNQTGGGAINLEFPGGLNFSISNYYSDAVIPRKGKEVTGISGAADAYRELPYNANDFNARAKYRFVDRWAAEVRYNNYDYRYKQAIDEDGTFNRNLYGCSLYYRFTPKVDALVDYNYSTVDYKTTPINDNTNHSAYLGLSFDPTAKLNGYLKLGWAEKDYEEDQPGRTKSFSAFSSLVDLTYNMSRYHILTLKGNRIIEEDVDTNAPFTTTDFSLGYRHFLAWNEKVSLNANLGYGTKKFEKATTDADGTLKIRDDKKWYGGAGIGYAPQRWLSLGLNYTYTRDKSNFINYDYKENKVILNVLIAF